MFMGFQAIMLKYNLKCRLLKSVKHVCPRFLSLLLEIMQIIIKRKDCSIYSCFVVTVNFLCGYKHDINYINVIKHLDCIMFAFHLYVLCKLSFNMCCRCLFIEIVLKLL